MDWLALITQLAGTAAGQAAAGMDKAAAMKLIQAAVDDMGKINVPTLQKLLLQQQKNTELAGIKEDPLYRSQLGAADAQLGDIIGSGGLTLADKAALNEIRNRTAQQESAGRRAIEQQMAARGTLDSGAQLAMQLDENSRSANALARADEAAAAQAQQRAFEAIRERARMASQGLDRDYQQKAAAARAQDAINAGNTAIANTAARYDADQAQRQFENQMRLAQAKAEPGYTLSDAYKGRAADTERTGAQMGGIGAAAIKARNTGNTNATNYYDDKATGLAPQWPDSSPDEWSQYPGSSSAGLSGASTREDNPIVGYDANGNPIYRSSNPQRLTGQNF